MDPVTAALLMGGAQIGTSLFAGHASRQSQASANRANIKLAREQMDFQDKQARTQRIFTSRQASRQMNFQERLSSTAMQRARKDMEKAGFNPLLALPGGASTPSGAAGTSSAPQGARTEIKPEVLAGVNSAISMMSNLKDIELKSAQADLASTTEETKKAKATEQGILNRFYQFVETVIDKSIEQNESSAYEPEWEREPVQLKDIMP